MKIERIKQIINKAHQEGVTIVVLNIEDVEALVNVADKALKITVEASRPLVNLVDALEAM